MLSSTLTGHVRQKRRNLESNQDQDLRRVLCCPLHHRDVFKQEPTTGFAPASTGLQDRRLSQSSHVGTQARARGVRAPTDRLVAVRQFWRLAALPGAHSCDKSSRRLEPGAIVVNYFASSTFQYASLMNFDQLSIRTSCAV